MTSAFDEDIREITRLIRERITRMNAVFLAHNYQRPEVQDAADIVGDSLALSVAAAGTSADVILFAGVHFMAETAKILSPRKLVLMPRTDAGCPMADMIEPEDLLAARKRFPTHAVVTYVNSSAATKAASDIICTSANAVQVVESVEADEILFTPDKNLASWVARFTKKTVRPWPGYCPTHERLVASMVFEMKERHPDADVVVHPECRPEVCDLADAVLSTSGMLKHCKNSPKKSFLIGTEEGLLHRLRKENSDKEFILINKTLHCPNMKLTTLRDCLHALDHPSDGHEITVDERIREGAKRSLDRMLAVKV